MLNFIKKIIEGQVDEETHNKFIRFGKGAYEREAFKIKVMGKKITVKAGFDYVDILLRFMAQQLTQEVEVSGAIVTSDKSFGDKLEARDISFDSRGKKYTIKASMSADDFRSFLEELGDTYPLLAIKSGDYKTALKKSPPKPGKLVEEFITATFAKGDLGKIMDEFLWDEDEFTTAEIKHTVVVEDIVVPKEYQDDFAMARLKAVRKGKLVRKVTVDGKEKETEYELSV